MEIGKAQITIKDIAKALNCAPSTVSRALKDSKDISEETRELIKNYAKQHNYKPNLLAQNLRVSHTRTIGVIVPQIVHHFFSCVLDGIETIASENNYNVLIAQSDEKYDKEVNIIHSFLSERVCGVITSLAKETTHYEHYKELTENNIPIVFYDRICTGLNTERVVVDDYTGAFAAVEYLIQTGCKRIFFYCSPLTMEIAKNRRNGYVDAMKRYNIPFTDKMIKICDTREKAIDITPSILETDERHRPDAFFAINDETASGILYCCKSMGIKVPDEVSICGFGDDAIAYSTDPKLTTVEQHGVDVGKSAVKTLIEKLEGKPAKNRIVKTNLIVRGTTK